MWVAKFKVWHKTCKIRPLCHKYNVTDFVYVIKSWTEKDKFCYIQYHILQGEEKNRKKFVRDFRKIPGIRQLEYKGNCMFTLREDSLSESFEPIFDSKIIQTKPVIQRSDQFEEWELASWDKKYLMNIFKIPSYRVELSSVEKKNFSEIVLAKPSPNLTSKQREAIDLAIKNGYYNFPRKIDLVHLAKIAKVSRPSFQERLRVAEKKVMPMFA